MRQQLFGFFLGQEIADRVGNVFFQQRQGEIVTLKI